MMRRRMLAAAMAWLGALSVSAAADLPTDSLYQLSAHLTTPRAETVGWDLHRGHPALVSMFYGGCTAACPMLITGVQVYESHLDKASRARLRVLLVSFDATHDTPQRLAELARLHRADPTRWTLASASEPDARRIAALLGVSYRRLPDGDFDHSLLITLLDAQGRVVASTSKPIGDVEFEAKLRAATAADPG